MAPSSETCPGLTSSSPRRCPMRMPRGGSMKTTLLSTILLVAFLLSACGSAPVQPTPDVAFIQTSAANTVIANFTLTAKVPTNTPLAALTVPATPLESATPATTPGTQSVPTATLQPGAATPT